MKRSFPIRLLAVCFALTACMSGDDAFFQPTPVDVYELNYSDSVPDTERVPPDLQQLVDFPEDDGTRIYGAMVMRPPNESATAPTVLYSHGSGGNLENNWDFVGLVWSMGANVLAYDYPGYGRTGGKPTEGGIYQAGHAAVNYLRSLGAAIDQNRLYLYGYSLGGSAAIELGTTIGPYHGLIVESAWTSAQELVAEAFLVVPSSFLTEFKFDNLSKIDRASHAAAIGTIFFHGTDDHQVAPHFSQDLYNAIGDSPHELWYIGGAGHEDVYSHEGPDGVYRAKLRAFLGK